MRLRAEYDLTKPNRVFGMRLETGALWSPNQGFLYFDGASTGAVAQQKLDLMLGVNVSASPIPHARVAPYITAGVFGRQVWTNGSSYRSNGTYATSTYTRGDIIGTLGVGLRLRFGGHALQVELRRLHTGNGLTIGTRLPF